MGHSLGGATARNYSAAYSDNIFGILLVDPENPRDVEIIKEIDPIKGPAEIAAIKTNDYNVSAGRWCFLDAVWSKTEANDFNDIGDIPVTLIATTMRHEDPETIFNSDIGRKRWGEIQQEWVRTFPQGKFISTDKSGHFIQDSEPDLVLRELLLLINSADVMSTSKSISGKWKHDSKPAIIDFDIDAGKAFFYQHEQADSAGLNLIKDIRHSSNRLWVGNMFDGYQNKYVKVSISQISDNVLSIFTEDQNEVLRLERYLVDSE